jgi:organic radical activating enzyme
MPFVSVRIEDNKNNTSSRIRPCCHYEPPKKFNTLDEYLKSDTLYNLQTHLLTQDTLPLGCRVCSDLESRNQISPRIHRNKFFQEHPIQTNIVDLDLFPSNVCNLTCVMCSPKFSSAIGMEQKKMGLITEVINFDETDLICNTISTLSNIQSVGLAGGEFFYAKHAQKILQSIIDANINELKITTNGTIFNIEQINLLSKISKLRLWFSIDGVGPTYDFVRYPAHWNDVKKNILSYRDSLPNSSIEITIVMQPLVVFSVFDWLEFVNEFGFKEQWQNIIGEDLGWSILTSQEKEIVCDFLLENSRRSGLTSKQKVAILNYAKSTIINQKFDQKNRDRFVSKISKLMIVRNLETVLLDKFLFRWPSLIKEIADKIHEDRTTHHQ